MDGTGPKLNPFTIDEYDKQCASNVATHTCAAGKPTHLAPAALKGFEAACKASSGSYVLDDACVKALTSIPAFPGHRAQQPTDPVFAEAQMCRTRLNGTFHAMCDTKEITYDALRSKLGGSCDQCCTTVLKEQEAKNPEKHSATKEIKHATYIPFRT